MMRLQILLLLLLLPNTMALGVGVLDWLDPSTPLNEVPMIMSHDTATGYLGQDHLYELQESVDDQLIGWTKTQIGSVTDQIKCGARSFDMRPYVSAQQGLIAHHGGVVVPYPFKAMMLEMVEWANANPKDFLVPEIYHCGGETDELKEQCDEEARLVLEELNIPYITKEECPDVMQGMTLGDALARGKLEGGGSVLAIWGQCFVSNYDSTRNCRGYEFETAGVSRKYSCWINGTNPRWPVENLFEYLDATIQAGPPSDGRLWQLQALWQAVQDSIVLGGAEGSSLLVDIRYSRLNRFMFENLTTSLDHRRWDAHDLSKLNLIELDYVCDQGSFIYKALQSKFNLTFGDYPDDIVINTTGLSQSILAGDDVILPSIPANFTPLTFTDSQAIRSRHGLIRWGKTKNIVEFFNGSSDKQQDYLVGIFATTLVLLVIFFLWAIILLVCKWTGKLGWLAGKPPEPPVAPKVLIEAQDSNDDIEQDDSDNEEDEDSHENESYGTSDPIDDDDDDDDDEEQLSSHQAAIVYEKQVTKFKKKVRRIRITTLICGLLILALSGALIGDGFKELNDTLDASAQSLEAIRTLVRRAQIVSDGYLVQVNATTVARANLINILVNDCNITNITAEDIGTIDLIELNETLNNSTDISDAVDKMNHSLDGLVGDLQSVEDTVDDTARNVIFPIAIAFILLVDLVVVVFLVGLVLAWRKQQPRLFYDCTTKVAIPVFLVLLLCAYVVSTLALVAATLAADFCVDTPDTKLLDIINASAPFDEELAYIVKGCNPALKPEMLHDAFKAAEWLIVEIYNWLDELSQLPPDEIPCPNPTQVLAAISAVQEEYAIYVEGLYDLLDALRCDRLNAIYALLAYSTGCVSGFNSLSKIFIYLFSIALCSMAIVTLRVAWYDIEDVQDEEAAAAAKEAQEEVAMEEAPPNDEYYEQDETDQHFESHEEETEEEEDFQEARSSDIEEEEDEDRVVEVGIS